MGDIYRVSYDQEVYGVQLTNVYHYDNTVPPAGGTNVAEDLAEGFENTIHAAIRLALGDTWSGVCVRVARIDPEAGSEFGRIITTQAGANAQPTFPANVVICTTKYTDLLTKRGRGRSYQSGFPEVAEVEGVLTTVYHDAWVTAQIVVASEVTGGGGVGKYQPGVWSQAASAIQPQVAFEIQTAFRKLRGRTSSSCALT